MTVDNRTTFPFIIDSLECDTAEEAWSSWASEAEHFFYWIKGVKMWRRTPQLYHDKDLANDREIYIVRARAVALMSLPDGFEEADINGPYPEQKDPFEGIISLGLK